MSLAANIPTALLKPSNFDMLRLLLLSVDAAGQLTQSAATLTLRLCRHSTSEGLAVAPVTPGDNSTTLSGAPASPARAATPTATAVTPTRPGSSSSSKGKSAKQSSASRNSRSSSSSSASRVAGGVTQAYGGQAAGAAVSDWQLRLLSSGVDWSNSAHVQLLERLAVVHLQGRLLFQGERCGLSPLFKQRDVGMFWEDVGRQREEICPGFPWGWCIGRWSYWGAASCFWARGDLSFVVRVYHLRGENSLTWLTALMPHGIIFFQVVVVASFQMPAEVF